MERTGYPLFANQRLELRHDLVVASELQLRLDELLECGDTEVVESGDLALGERLIR
jgi:hypothetical protein